VAYFAGSQQDRIPLLYSAQTTELANRSEYHQETADALEERDQMIGAIHELTEHITSDVDLDEVLDSMSREVVEVGIFRSLMVALVNEKDRTIRVTSSAFRHPSKGTIIKKAEDGIIGATYGLDDENITAEVGRTGEMQILEEWDDRFDTNISEPDAHKGKVSYFIPIKIGRRTIGVMASASSMDLKEATLAKIATMSPLFDQVAIALEHAVLIRDLRVAKDAAEASTRIIRGLYEIASNDQWDIERQIEETLSLGCDLL
jgi:transcriptional regulator with GAF, ATPase, and Fis domain